MRCVLFILVVALGSAPVTHACDMYNVWIQTGIAGGTYIDIEEIGPRDKSCGLEEFTTEYAITGSASTCSSAAFPQENQTLVSRSGLSAGRYLLEGTGECRTICICP